MDNGSTIGMDRFGMEHVLADDRRVRTVLALLELGYADRMVLSHDAAFYSHVTSPSWRSVAAPRCGWTRSRDISFLSCALAASPMTRSNRCSSVIRDGCWRWRHEGRPPRGAGQNRHR